MKNSWRPVAAAFLLGCLLGAFAGSRCQRLAYHRFWQRGPDAQRSLRRLTRELSLDEPQQHVVQGIVERYRQQVLLLHQETSTKMEAIRASMRSDISKLLTADQQKKFETMIARFAHKHPSEMPQEQPQTPRGHPAEEK